MREASVSRTAYHSLARRESAFPRSVRRLADTLGVTETDLFEAVPPQRRDVDRLVAEARDASPVSTRKSISKTSGTRFVLREPPLQRLRGAYVVAELPLFGEREIAFLAALRAARVEFLVVGLSAAALQGAPVVTRDVDLWVRDPG